MSDPTPRRAAVGARRSGGATSSSLGTSLGELIGGKRAHAPQLAAATEHMVETLAAGDGTTRQLICEALTEWLATHPDDERVDVARTLLGARIAHTTHR